MVGFHSVSMAHPESHFPESPSLRGSGIELARREIHFDMWKAEVKHWPLQSNDRFQSGQGQV